eukprot:3780153-Pyramimonas_sp.AAC.1
MTQTRGACAPSLAAVALVEAAVRGAALAGAARRTVAVVARSAISAVLFQLGERRAPTADGGAGGARHED